MILQGSVYSDAHNIVILSGRNNNIHGVDMNSMKNSAWLILRY